MKILRRSDDFRLESHPTMGYAVFRRVTYPSGETAFWQQCCRWYTYRAYAERIFNEKAVSAHV